jgi:hypothetical protein
MVTLLGAGGTKPHKQKTPAMAGVSFTVLEVGRLLDLTFLVHHVFAHDRIVFFPFEFVRCSSLVLVRGIEVPCTSGRVHSDFVSHGNSPLNLFAASADIFQHLLNAALVDNTHPFTGYT